MTTEAFISVTKFMQDNGISTSADVTANTIAIKMFISNIEKEKMDEFAKELRKTTNQILQETIKDRSFDARLLLFVTATGEITGAYHWLGISGDPPCQLCRSF